MFSPAPGLKADEGFASATGWIYMEIQHAPHASRVHLWCVEEVSIFV